MKYFYPKLHTQHNPSLDLSDGLPGYKHLEVASRVELILKGLLKAYEAEVVYVQELADDEVRTIHDDDYVDFLLDITKEIEGKEEYVPPIFRKDLSKAPLYFRGGMYCDEIGTPIGIGSVNAALNSAKTALNAAEYLFDEKSSAFVLTRPPGHHAGRRRYGGYCFFNNAYLCAEKFVNAGLNAAVIDVDYHIGDGSLEFATKDMPYYSLHSNTHRNYPYLEADFSNENEYVTLHEFKTGISGELYLKDVQTLLNAATKNKPDVIVLSLGFDTLGTDYTQDEYIYVQAEDYRVLGEMVGSLEQEVLILLEGGYDAEYLDVCAENFMSGFISKKGL